MIGTSIKIIRHTHGLLNDRILTNPTKHQKKHREQFTGVTVIHTFIHIIVDK